MLQGGDTLLLELTKLKVSNGQLEDALKEVNEATHRYLFWTSDVRPMTIARHWKSPVICVVSFRWTPSVSWAKPV